MLYLAKTLGQLRFGELMEVYIEGNRKQAESSGLLQVEQEFYQYLRECFFQMPDAVYAIWVENNKYVSALRLESYKDGLLLNALETAPQCRNQGYACKLLGAVQTCFAGKKLYSHVGKENAPSLAVHEKCGFRKISDSAAYIDGSVDSKAVTLFYQSVYGETI